MQSPKPSRAHWRKHVRAWKTSGLSSTAYAAQAGINANTLTWWRWRLGKEANRTKQTKPSATPRSAKTPRRVPPPTPTLELVELLKPAAAPQTPVPQLELEVGTVRLRVPVGFDEPTLTRTLAILERPR